MKRSTLILMTVTILSALILSACGGGAGEDTLKVATDATWPPFEFVDEESKEIIGLDIDLMNAIAEKAGLSIEYVNVSWDPLLAGMAECQYDMAISAMSITPERAESFLFSVPYIAAGQLVTVAIDNTDINGPEDLVGKVAGAQIGTTGAIEVENIEGAELKTYDEIGLAFQDLMNGQIDAVVSDNTLAIGFIAQNSDKIKSVGDTFTAEEFGVAICMDNPELKDAVDAALTELLNEGYVDELTAKWFSE